LQTKGGGDRELRIKLKDPNALKKLLIVNGFSQKEFAEGVEVTPAFLSQIVNEERYPSAKTAKKIADHFKLDFDDIFFIDDDCKSYQDCNQGAD
jgi:transcriptional regulator with XRE-family HTH domain